MCEILSPKRFQEYNDWINIGFCLHNINLDLFEVWNDLSKKYGGEKYKRGEISIGTYNIIKEKLV